MLHFWLEGKNLPAKYTYWDYDTDPNGVEVEKDNYVTFHLSTMPFFDVELSEGGKVEVVEGWGGMSMTSYTFPIAADGTAKGTVTMTLKKDFGADPFDEVAGYGLPAGESVAVGSVAFGDQTSENNTDYVTVMLTLTKPAQGGDGTALEDATVEANKAVKVLENGVVYIIKNGVKYTVTGVAVK